ncbi:MAG: hypothetical protein CMJ18_08330 [Phycisphaeraceae bacterium]|nr:hypothetical protein [Phycisphaeraceae bacterium]
MRRIRSNHSSEAQEPAEAVTQLVVAFLEWNASRRSARAAHRRLLDAMVDNNDLRVSSPDEIMEVLGPRYPLAQERSERMHEALHDIFMREQAVNLDHLARLTKKEVRDYLNTLPGITPYVAAQVTLMCFGGHAVPVDDQLADLLREQEVVDPDATLPEIESFLERQIKADSAVDSHAVLMAWVDAGSQRVSASAPMRKGSNSRSRTKSTRTTKRPAKKKAKRTSGR